MYRILLMLLFSIPFLSYSQIYDKPGNYGLQYKRLKADSAFKVPVFTDTFRRSNLAGDGDLIYSTGAATSTRGFYGIINGAYRRIADSSYLVTGYFKNAGNPWTATWSLGSTTSQAGRILINNVDVMDYFVGGNVGIGTNGVNNGFRLDVNGTVRFNNSVIAQTVTSVSVLDIGNIRIADDPSARYIQAPNGISIRNTAIPNNFLRATASSVMIGSNTALPVIIAPGNTSGIGIRMTSSATIPAFVRMTFENTRNDGAQRAFLNTPDFTSIGATPMEWYIYSGTQLSGSVQGNVILCHDATSRRGNVGIGVVAPTSALHLPAGVTGVGGAPFKITIGALTTIAEIGAFAEYDGTSFYSTNSTGVRGRIQVNRTFPPSAAGTLALLSTYSHYVFTGTTTTWTLPTITGNTDVVLYMKNRGSGNITLNSNAGGNDIYNTSLVNTITILPGEARILWNDGTVWDVE